MTVAVFIELQILLILILILILGIPEFYEILNGSRGIPGEVYGFQSCEPSIFYRISNVVHGVCVDIFWNRSLKVVKKAVVGHQNRRKTPFVSSLNESLVHFCRIYSRRRDCMLFSTF